MPASAWPHALRLCCFVRQCFLPLLVWGCLLQQSYCKICPTFFIGLWRMHYSAQGMLSEAVRPKHWYSRTKQHILCCKVSSVLLVSLSFLRVSSSVYLCVPNSTVSPAYKLHKLLLVILAFRIDPREILLGIQAFLFSQEDCRKMIWFRCDILQVLITFVNLHSQHLSITLVLFVFIRTLCFVASCIMTLPNVTISNWFKLNDYWPRSWLWPALQNV